jgi:AcrR family transcriptional regulator
MSSSVSASPKRPQYHHGDLRNALLEAARTLAQERGADALTLRHVARQAGVSHAAAYHHFTDKNDLLRALAIQAFKALEIELQRAIQDHADDHDAFETLGATYLRFALNHAAEFRFMFRRDLCMPEGVPDPLEIASRGAQAALTAFVHVRQSDGTLKAGDPQATTLSFWSTIHGLTTIILETPVFKGIELQNAEHLIRGAVRQLLEGIADKR